MEKIVFGVFQKPDHPRFGQFIERVDFLYEDFQGIVERYESTHPDLKGKIAVSYTNIVLAVGRYFNDLILFEAEHDIERFHRSKIVAYQLRWMLLHPPVVSLASREEFSKMSRDAQSCVLNLAYVPISALVAHFLEQDVPLYHNKRPELKKSIEEMMKRLHYYAKTGRYDPKIATLFFEMVVHAA